MALDSSVSSVHLPKTTIAVLDALSHGGWCSGEQLGSDLGMSRAAISKHVQALLALGIPIERIAGKGYCLQGAFSLLAPELLASESRAVHYFHILDSTNAFLLHRVRAAQPFHGHVCLAEQQSAGRGRRGKAWHSPFAKNIYLSVAWSFSGGVSVLEGLSLLVGIACARTLAQHGVKDVRLKWPNDILISDKKLGGILVELGGDLAGDCAAVIGLGMNVDMQDANAENHSELVHVIDQPWVSLRSLGYRLSRTELAMTFLAELESMLCTYEQDRFAAYQDEWNQLNAHQGCIVNLISGDRSIQGHMCGVSKTGAVLLNVDGDVTEYVGGELSLRAAS